MGPHDIQAWKGNRSEVAKSLRKVLTELKLIDDSDTTYVNSMDEQLPILFYSERGFFKEEDVLKQVAEYLGIKVYDFDSEEVIDKTLELMKAPELSMFTTKEWYLHRAIPVCLSDKKLCITTADPLNKTLMESLKFVTDRYIQISISSEKDILKILNAGLGLTDRDEVDLIIKGKPMATAKEQEASSGGQYLESSTLDDNPSEDPVIRLVNKILSRVIQANASDLHFTPQKEALIVKARVDGIMQPIVEVPSHLKAAAISRMKLLCGMDIAEKRRPQDGRLRIKTRCGVKDVRVSTVPSAYGENLVARILDSDFNHVDFKSLGMDGEVQARLEEALQNSCKVNLVTGPTGSGKTSTLYAGLVHLHNGEKNIITLEDPIEYRIDGITQIQVNPKIEFSFAEGLRSILRQDPDVVLVGEIRDEETASISMKTAQTGHLVLSTLHTNSAPGAITRLKDLNVPDYLIASSLGSVLAQRLVRKLCPDCSKTLSKKEAKKYGLDKHAKCAIGCKKCRNTGYKGRVGVYSLLTITEEIAMAIRNGASEEKLEQLARKEGYKTLYEAGIDLVNKGLTSMKEILRVIGVPSEGGITYQTEDQSSSVSGLFPSKRVMLVEDDPDTRGIFSAIFESEMYEVLEAFDGRDALEKLQQKSVDLIVCDVMMPRLNGYDFLKRLRAHQETADLPVLMLTAGATEDGELQSLSTGADDYVPKTSSIDVLLARMQRLMQRAAA